MDQIELKFIQKKNKYVNMSVLENTNNIFFIFKIPDISHKTHSKPTNKLGT